MNADSRQLIAAACRRARTVRVARDPALRRAIVKRVLFELRVALSKPAKGARQ